MASKHIYNIYTHNFLLLNLRLCSVVTDQMLVHFFFAITILINLFVCFSTLNPKPPLIKAGQNATIASYFQIQKKYTRYSMCRFFCSLGSRVGMI